MSQESRRAASHKGGHGQSTSSFGNRPLTYAMTGRALPDVSTDTKPMSPKPIPRSPSKRPPATVPAGGGAAGGTRLPENPRRQSAASQACGRRAPSGASGSIRDRSGVLLRSCQDPFSIDACLYARQLPPGMEPGSASGGAFGGENVTRIAARRPADLFLVRQIAPVVWLCNPAYGSDCPPVLPAPGVKPLFGCVFRIGVENAAAAPAPVDAGDIGDIEVGAPVEFVS